MKIEFKSSKEIWEGVGTLMLGVVIGWATLGVQLVWRDMSTGYHWMWAIMFVLSGMLALAGIGARRISFNTSTKVSHENGPRHTQDGSGG